MVIRGGPTRPRGAWLAPRALAGLAALLFLLSLGVGPVRLPPAAVLGALAGGGPDENRMIVQESGCRARSSRLPSALSSACRGRRCKACCAIRSAAPSL